MNKEQQGNSVSSFMRKNVSSWLQPSTQSIQLLLIQIPVEIDVECEVT